MFTGNNGRCCEPRVCGEIKCTCLYFSPKVVFYKASPCDRYSVFIDGIFHQRHENWLHSLIARTLLHWLPIPNVLDNPEAFFVKYQQEKIMKSNRILQKTVLNTHRVVRSGYFVQRWVFVRDTTHFEEGFLKNDTKDFEEFDQNDICFFGDFWILITIWNSEQKRVRPDMFGFCLSYKHALGDAKWWNN